MGHFRDSALFVSIKRGTIVNSLFIATNNFIKRNNNYYSLKDCYICNRFDIYENVGGDVFIKTYTKMKHSGVEYVNEIKLERDTVNGMRLETLM